MRFLGVLILLLVPVQAMALSCARPSVERTFQSVSTSKDTYIVVEGRLTLDTRKLPRAHSTNPKPPKMTRIQARLQGKSLSKSGFKAPFDRQITLYVSCLGPWCGAAQNGEQVLAFLKREDGGYGLGVNPCGGHVFSNPKPAVLKAVARCFRRGNCKG